MAMSDRVYDALIGDEDHGCGHLPDEACREVRGNTARLLGALGLQQVGDRIVDAKTVLPWVLASLGAPAALTGLLVPVREAGSLLPQAGFVPIVRRLALRKWVWVAGTAGQAAAVVVMVAAVATTTGITAGLWILGALAAFALSRALSSIAWKDVLGRTVPKGQRGRVNGLATAASGLVAITVGLGMRGLLGAEVERVVFVALLAGAATAWVGAGVIFATVREAPGEHDPTVRAGALAEALRRLRHEAAFRRFVLARALLLVSALSPPFVVQLANTAADGSAASLGPFLIASGIAALVGGRVWGGQADRSSRRTMMLSAGGAAAVLVVFLAALASADLRAQPLVYLAAYLALQLAHTGARVGRKTYLVDLAEGNTRTDYVAVSNTAMGVLLLVIGGLTAAVAQLGVEAALVVLAGFGVAGVIVARRLPETEA